MSKGISDECSIVGLVSYVFVFFFHSNDDLSYHPIAILSRFPPC
jgi:hypothetical protein